MPPETNDGVGVEVKRRRIERYSIATFRLGGCICIFPSLIYVLYSSHGPYVQDICNAACAVAIPIVTKLNIKLAIAAAFWISWPKIDTKTMTTKLLNPNVRAVIYINRFLLQPSMNWRPHPIASSSSSMTASRLRSFRGIFFRQCFLVPASSGCLKRCIRRLEPRGGMTSGGFGGPCLYSLSFVGGGTSSSFLTSTSSFSYSSNLINLMLCSVQSNIQVHQRFRTVMYSSCRKEKSLRSLLISQMSGCRSLTISAPIPELWQRSR